MGNTHQRALIRNIDPDKPLTMNEAKALVAKFGVDGKITLKQLKKLLKMWKKERGYDLHTPEAFFDSIGEDGEYLTIHSLVNHALGHPKWSDPEQRLVPPTDLDGVWVDRKDRPQGTIKGNIFTWSVSHRTQEAKYNPAEWELKLLANEHNSDASASVSGTKQTGLILVWADGDVWAWREAAEDNTDDKTRADSAGDADPTSRPRPMVSLNSEGKALKRPILLKRWSKQASMIEHETLCEELFAFSSSDVEDSDDEVTVAESFNNNPASSDEAIVAKPFDDDPDGLMGDVLRVFVTLPEDYPADIVDDFESEHPCENCNVCTLQ